MFGLLAQKDINFDLVMINLAYFLFAIIVILVISLYDKEIFKLKFKFFCILREFK